jgi:hypothetical protein
MGNVNCKHRLAAKYPRNMVYVRYIKIAPPSNYFFLQQTQNSCASADQEQIPPHMVKLPTSFGLGNNQCIYYNVNLKNNIQDTDFSRSSTQTHSHTYNKVTLPLHTVTFYTTRDTKGKAHMASSEFN